MPALALKSSTHGWTAYMGAHALGYVTPRPHDRRGRASWIMLLPAGHFGTRMMNPAMAPSADVAMRELVRRIAEWFEAAGQAALAGELRDLAARHDELCQLAERG